MSEGHKGRGAEQGEADKSCVPLICWMFDGIWSITIMLFHVFNKMAVLVRLPNINKHTSNRMCTYRTSVVMTASKKCFCSDFIKGQNNRCSCAHG